MVLAQRWTISGKLLISLNCPMFSNLIVLMASWLLAPLWSLFIFLVLGFLWKDLLIFMSLQVSKGRNDILVDTIRKHTVWVHTSNSGDHIIYFLSGSLLRMKETNNYAEKANVNCPNQTRMHDYSSSGQQGENKGRILFESNF